MMIYSKPIRSFKLFPEICAGLQMDINSVSVSAIKIEVRPSCSIHLSVFYDGFYKHADVRSEELSRQICTALGIDIKSSWGIDITLKDQQLAQVIIYRYGPDSLLSVDWSLLNGEEIRESV